MGTWQVPGYSEVRVLGEGAQGRVVLARHDASGAPAAIKYLSERLCEDARFRERFRGEADLLRRVRNPYIAQMWGLVEAPEGAAIVMEAVDGASLKEVLARQGALTPEASLTVLKGSLLGLAAAHEVGVVHRDYKPANVIVRGDGLSKLIDFGIAVDAGEAGRSGTPVYMAPEQWRAEPASPATDVYAATCVFFECVTGRRPFTAEDQRALMNLHLTGEIPVEAVPEPLRPLVSSGLAKDPWGRPAGAAAFVSELESAAAAAYGLDWEGRGVRALAGAAAALAMIFPLAALGMAPAGSGAAGAAGTAGAAGASGAAGTAGAGSGTVGAAGAAGGKGVLGVVGAKGATAIAGALVVTGVAGGAGYYAATGDDKPRPAPTPSLSFALAAHRTSLGNPPLQGTGQIVQVKGGSNAALVKRINDALLAPVNSREAEYRRAMTTFNATASAASVKAAIRLSGPRYVSVRYDFELRSKEITHASWNRARTVTVDLKTGTTFKNAAEMVTPAGLTGTGVAGFSDLVMKADASRTCLSSMRYGPADFRNEAVIFALWPKELEVIVDAPATTAAREMACGQNSVKIPYDRLTTFLKPEVLAAIPYKPAPAPTRS
ncbi:serine/threonine-protein kinase [Actinomadura rudentiformis]|uniref:non-specific serine/threonine protein kinase n=1 Tax=Actinomadura rudentiformis TaxID=359158 RepID=A0A6H9YAS7_9ACTN|nr:serine/threonine-protein kinase [Actinomadura rudentiformis]KAB2342391.1 serine/threonine protein kinase [Actinomadura rudentiformis]